MLKVISYRKHYMFFSVHWFYITFTSGLDFHLSERTYKIGDSFTSTTHRIRFFHIKQFWLHLLTSLSLFLLLNGSNILLLMTKLLSSVSPQTLPLHILTSCINSTMDLLIINTWSTNVREYEWKPGNSLELSGLDYRDLALGLAEISCMNWECWVTDCNDSKRALDFFIV